jgi:hypothetical protein
VGPSPLRFRPEFRRDPAVVLPPLAVPDESTNTPAEMPVKSNDVELPEIDLQYAEPATPVAETTPTPTAASAGNPAGPMVPQMLLQYFAGRTNQSTIVTAPVEFTPPAPPSPNRSSAVYISR